MDIGRNEREGIGSDYKFIIATLKLNINRDFTSTDNEHGNQFYTENVMYKFQCSNSTRSMKCSTIMNVQL